MLVEQDEKNAYDASLKASGAESAVPLANPVASTLPVGAITARLPYLARPDADPVADRSLIRAAAPICKPGRPKRSSLLFQVIAGVGVLSSCLLIAFIYLPQNTKAGKQVVQLDARSPVPRKSGPLPKAETDRSRIKKAATLEPKAKKEPEKSPEVDGVKRIPLFDGKDSSAWMQGLTESASWQVRNGILVSTGPSGVLLSKDGEFGNFHLRAEVKVNVEGFGGIRFRVPKAGASSDGYFAIIGTPPNQENHTGGLNGWGRRIVAVKEPVAPVEKWMGLEILANGNHVMLKIDGKVTADFMDPRTPALSGHLALQQAPNAAIQFRKIEVRKLVNESASDSTTPKPPILRKTPTGLFVSEVVDCAERAKRLEMGENFSIAGDWILSFQFLMPDLTNPLGELVFWGDDRPGRDAIIVCQKGSALAAGISNTHTDASHVITADLTPFGQGTWIKLTYCYYAGSNELELFLNDRLVKRERSVVSPLRDRPMPVRLGGANANSQRFHGQIKNLSLGNN